MATVFCFPAMLSRMEPLVEELASGVGHVAEKIFSATDACRIMHVQNIQSLWSGYGRILRVGLGGGARSSVIIKWVRPTQQPSQPRGWNTDASHQRKMRSYRAEASWYQFWASNLDESCRVAEPYLIEHRDQECLFVLEDLDSAGFDRRIASPNLAAARVCLEWLAAFHAKHVHQEPDGLWPIGTYWHLETRRDEFDVMESDEPLRIHAHAIDAALNNCRWKTIVHGDAKLANFCFTSEVDQVAAIDFQYVGAGCGIKDVVYCLGSCFDERGCEKHAPELLDHYFSTLRKLLSADLFSDLEVEWRRMYPMAWADFNRFLLGWCPGHQKLHRYSQLMTQRAIEIVSA